MNSTNIIFHTTLLLFTFSAASQAQDFFPHGLEFQSPAPLAPSTYHFFNSRPYPEPHQLTDSHVEHRCTDSGCPPLPRAAELKPAPALQGTPDPRVLSRKAIAGIVFGLVVVVFIGVGAYYVVATRRANLIRARPAQPLA